MITKNGYLFLLKEVVLAIMFIIFIYNYQYFDLSKNMIFWIIAPLIGALFTMYFIFFEGQHCLEFECDYVKGNNYTWFKLLMMLPITILLLSYYYVIT